MASQADLLIAIRAVDQASATLNNVANSLQKTGTAAQSSAPGFGSMAAAVGVGTIAAHGLMSAAGLLADGLRSAVSTAASFGQSMANIKATVPRTEFEQFGAQTQALAMRLGKDYPLSAAEAGKAMELLAQKGISLQAINNGAAEAVVQLASATGSDLVTAAGIAAVTMDVFKVSENDMSRVTDLMTGAMLRGGVTARDFGFAIQAGGTAVALAGGTIDDASIAIAAMAKAGIEGSDAGTSLKTMYMNLIPATKQQTAVARELGLITADGTNKFFDASGKVKSYEEISQVLATSLQGLTEKQKLSALETLFGSDAIRAASVAAKFGAGEFGNLGAAIREPGIAADAAKTKMDTLSGQMQQLSGSVETLSLKVGNQLAPYLQRAAVVATDFVNRLIDMADAVDLAPMLDNIGSALQEVSKYLYAAGQASSEFGELLGNLPVIGGLLNRVWQVIGSELVAVAALMRGDGAGAAEALGQAFSDVGTLAQDAATSMTNAITTMADGWNTLVDATTNAYDAVVNAVTSGWNTVVNTIDSAFSDVGAAVSSGWNWAVTAETQAAMADLMSAVGDAWSVVSAIIAEAFGGVVAAIGSGWSQAIDATLAAMNSILDAVSSVASPLIAVIADAMSGVVATVAGFAGEAWNAAASVAGNFAAGLRDGINARVAEIAGAAAGMIRSAIGAAQAAQESSSPSKKTYKLGEDFVAGFINAVEDGQFGAVVQQKVGEMLAAFEDYRIVVGEIGRVEQEIKDIREDAAAEARARATEMITITSEEIRLRKDLAIAEKDLLPVRQELRALQTQIRDAEKLSLPDQQKVIANTAQINQLKLQELQLEGQMIGLDRRSKEYQELSKAKEAVDQQIASLRNENDILRQGGVIAADAYRARAASVQSVVDVGEKELQAIKNVIEQLDAEQKVFKANEDVITNATKNEIGLRERLIDVFKNEKEPIEARITAGRALIDTMYREGQLTKEEYEAIQKVITANVGAKAAIQGTTSATQAATQAADRHGDELAAERAAMEKATVAADKFEDQLNAVDQADPTVTIKDNTAAVGSSIATLASAVSGLEQQDPSVTVSTPGLTEVQTSVDTLWSRLGQVAKPVAIGFSADVPTTVNVNGISTDNLTSDNSELKGIETLDADNVQTDDFKASDSTTLKDVDAEDAAFDDAEFKKTDISGDIQDSEFQDNEFNDNDFGSKSNARGGFVTAGSMSLVGEEGPELVAWGASGTVIPTGPSMAMLGGAGGGTVVNQPITVNVTVEGSVRVSRDLAMEIREELIRLGRTNGTIFGGYS